MALALWIFNLLFAYHTRKGIAEAGQNAPISVSLSDLFVSTQMLLFSTSRSLNPASVKTTLIRPLLLGIQMIQTETVITRLKVWLHCSCSQTQSLPRRELLQPGRTEVRAPLMSGSPREKLLQTKSFHFRSASLLAFSLKLLAQVKSKREKISCSF